MGKDLPGFERLQRALELVQGNAGEPGPAVSRAEMVKWMTKRRPELAEADIKSTERLADETKTLFRDRARAMGADG
jgi:hypothetical protein